MASTDTLPAEHAALREGAGLLDRSEAGKLLLTGPGAKAALNGMLTNEIEDLEPGHGRYAALLTPKGKMLADARVIDTGDGLLLITERVALQALFDAVRRYKLGYDCELHKRTLESALLCLSGPESGSVSGAESAGLGSAEHDNAHADLAGARVLLIRADAGVDVVCEAADAERVRAALLDAGAVAVSEAAADALRVERGRPRYGVDIDESTIPQEAGLNDRAVSFTKGCYVGQETVARLFYKGKPNRHLRILRLSGPAATGEELRFGDKPVGRLGTVAVSPTLGPVALALVRREAEPGAELSVGDGTVTATVLVLPSS
jgi:folate-binding protein YgfZ